MKKVININFQGRVLPIEETAYELLKQYIDSLRAYFSNEEGRDEIINDIEGRIAELFFDRIKKGATCITDDEVREIMLSMGRPEDFDAQDAAFGTETTTGSRTKSQPDDNFTPKPEQGRGRYYRNEDDKIIGGVASGLANYLGIDPVILRIVFVVLFGALFWVYILLWIIVPSKSVTTRITKRLYRNPDNQVISGVCGGLAAYLNIEAWVPRLIFAAPFLLAIISGSFNIFWWDWDFGFAPRFFTGSIGFTLFVTYVILWIALPLATTTSEKLEMRGEKVDLNSIRNTIKEDMSGFKQKAEKFSEEVKEKANQFSEKAREFGNQASRRATEYAKETGPAAKRAGNGIGHVIGVLFKAFFLFIAAIVALALFLGLVALLFSGFSVLPFKNFFLSGVVDNSLAWGFLFLFIGVPIIGLIIWIIRRIMGVRSGNRYLGYTFASLWTIGLFCGIGLAGKISRNFKARVPIEETVAINQPQNGKMLVKASISGMPYYESDWFGVDYSDMPFLSISDDTIYLKTVRINVVKSKDGDFHVNRIKFARGRTPQQARMVAENFSFQPNQIDSTLYFPAGFGISRQDQFRNQQVLIIIEVPVGKRIEMDRTLDNYEWFSVSFNRRQGFYYDDWEDNWGRNFNWRHNVEYVMTPDGLERVDRLDARELQNGRFKLNIDEKGIKMEAEGSLENSGDGEYRYKKSSSENKTNLEIRTTNFTSAGNRGLNELSVWSRLFQ